MNRAVKVVAVLLALLGAGSASASLPPAGTVHTDQTVDVSGLTVQIQQAFSNARSGRLGKAAPELDTIMAAPEFNQLTGDMRFQVIGVAAAIALQTGDYAKAHRLGMLATAFDQAVGVTWMSRLFSAFYLRDNQDASRCVVAIARQWPEQLEAIRPQAITLLHHGLRGAHDNDLDRSMLNALFDAKWQDGQSTYDTLWRDLALMLLEDRENDRAALVAQHVSDAQTALSMRVDKRFDAITQQHPERFDVARLLDAQIERARARVKAQPHQLESVQRLQDLLLEKGQNAEVLAASDAAVAHAEKGDGETAYTDFGESYNWVLNQRSLALSHDGRWDDAVGEMSRAAKRPEGGGVNVSQSINLAGLYVDLAEPDKAAAAIVEPGKMSPMGEMQWHYVKLQIAMEKNDARDMAGHMAYLRAHRTDDIATWQRVLLKQDDLDAAAALLVERLNSPEWRSEALVNMQHYKLPRRTPTMKTMDERWAEVTSRADVQGALAKVGRVEHVAAIAPQY